MDCQRRVDVAVAKLLVSPGCVIHCDINVKQCDVTRCLFGNSLHDAVLSDVDVQNQLKCLLLLTVV